MKVKAINKNKCFHITYYEYIKEGVLIRRYFKVWNNGNFYGTFQTLREARAKAHNIRALKFGYNSDSYVIENSSLSVNFYG
tara:strand:+ start:691 stop:933 length:243 start_codon:yes stop_codon:yes gene_type:complete